jgi:TRAP transporter TAXI family solute receptor
MIGVPPLGRRALGRAVAGVAVAPLVGGCTGADPSAVRIAAGTPDGIYAAFAALLAQELRRAEPDLRVDVLASEGSVDNLRLLRDGGADLALALEDGLDGSLRDVSDTERPLALARIYENYLQLLVPADSDLRSVADLRGRRLVLGAAGSGAAVTARVLLDAAGLTERDLTASYADLPEALAELVGRRVDAVVWSGGIPTPAVSRASRRRPLRMIDLGALAAPMSERTGYLYAARSVPPVDYGPAPDGTTIGVPNLLLARRDLDDRTAGDIVEVMATRAGRLIPDFVRGLQYLAPATMIQTGRVPLHPGAAAAYRELHG